MIAYYSYLTAFISFLALTILLLVSWRGVGLGRMLILACGTMTLWAGTIAMQESHGWFPIPVIWTMECLHNFAWIVFLWNLLSRPGLDTDVSGSIFIYRWSQATTAILLVFIWASPYLRGSFPEVFRPNLQLIGHAILVLSGLVLVEQIFRNTRTDERWRIKVLCFSLGTLLIYEFYLYSEAILFTTIREDLWAARGGVAAIMPPFIAISAQRNPEWSLNIFISRQVVFHSTTLLGAGIYMVLMSTVGYYIKFYGGEWGTVLQIAFMAGAFTVMALVLFSGQLRAMLRDFVRNNFFSHAFDYRQEWQRLIATLSASGGESLESKAIKALARLVESPAGLLWVRGGDGDFLLQAKFGSWDINIPLLSKDDPLVSFLEEKDAPVNLKELLTMPEAYEGLVMPDWIESDSQAWLFLPLWHTSGGTGAVALLSQSPSFTVWNLEVLDMLKISSRLVAGYLELEVASRALAEARQFEGFNRLSAFVMHDLKNLIAQLSLVVSNAAKHQDNPEFMRDAIKTVEHAVGKMHSLMSQLRNHNSAASASKFDLAEALREALESRSRQIPVPECDIVNSPIAILANRQRVVSALEHVIHNAQDATGKQGWVKAKLYKDQAWAIVQIEDNGCGMSQEFIANRLFKPFETTKGLTGMGIGAYESRMLARSIGGDLEVVSEEAKGSLFIFKFPLLEIPLGEIQLPTD